LINVSFYRKEEYKIMHKKEVWKNGKTVFICDRATQAWNYIYNQKDINEAKYCVFSPIEFE
jgi:hypothetical protein